MHTFTYAVTSLFLGRKGVGSGKSYLLADAGPSSPPGCEVLVQTSFVLNGNHPLGCIFMRKLNFPLQASSFESVLPATRPSHQHHNTAGILQPFLLLTVQNSMHGGTFIPSWEIRRKLMTITLQKSHQDLL